MEVSLDEERHDAFMRGPSPHWPLRPGGIVHALRLNPQLSEIAPARAAKVTSLPPPPTRCSAGHCPPILASLNPVKPFGTLGSLSSALFQDRDQVTSTYDLCRSSQLPHSLLNAVVGPGFEMTDQSWMKVRTVRIEIDPTGRMPCALDRAISLSWDHGKPLDIIVRLALLTPTGRLHVPLFLLAFRHGWVVVLPIRFDSTYQIVIPPEIRSLESL